jgi:cytidine deaminase
MINGAIQAMKQARPRRSGLRVGCVVATGLDEQGIPKMWAGGNIEVQWQRCYHAEECAILSMVNSGHTRMTAICVAAERDLFTPCGNCMDLIMEFGGPDCLVVTHNPASKKSRAFSAKELMPFYPTREYQGNEEQE